MRSRMSHKPFPFCPGSCVHPQPFDGAIAGDAFLILNYEGAVRLADLLTDNSSPQVQLDESLAGSPDGGRQYLIERVPRKFGNVLRVRVNFSVPALHLESLNEMMESLKKEHDHLQYAIIVYTSFRIRETAVTGYLCCLEHCVPDEADRGDRNWEEQSERDIHISR